MAGIKGKLLARVEKICGPESDEAKRAENTLQNAEKLAETEKANPRIVIAAGVLCQLPEDNARRALLELGMRMQDIDEICGIIAALHSSSAMDMLSYRVVHDAVLLAHIEEGLQDGSRGKQELDRFLTEGGRDLALAEVGGSFRSLRG
jgi:hypothetical protein